MYEICEHTADLGIHVRAESFAALLVDAGRGLTSVIAGDPGQVRAKVAESFTIVGSDPTWLVFDFVSELHAAFELRRMLFCEFAIDVTPDGLQATVRGERYDPTRHQLAHEVKAITQHELDVRQTSDGWEAFFIVDI
jgi:SHS2 domain-containing protein